jgi:sensor histidine kinase YesM
LQVDIDSSDDLGGALVPSLILQPLVENALLHGIAHKPGKGIITIRARQSDGGLLLEVSDNGGGLAHASKLEALGGIGIRNVRERLSQLYGNSAKLDVVDHNGSGVRATITMPLTRESRSEGVLDPFGTESAV